MNAVLKLIEPPTLQAEAQAALTERARLLDAVSAAESAAQKATDVFEREPSAEAHVASAVAQQHAKNARKLHNECTERTASVIERARVESETAAHAAEVASIQNDKTIAVARDRIAEVIAELGVRLRGAFVDLDDALVQFNGKCDRATHLARSIGRADVYRHVERKHAVAALNDSFRGPNHDYARDRVSLIMSDLDPDRFELFVTAGVGANK